MIEKLIILIILIMLSGFFSSIETAFTMLTDLRVTHLVEQKKKGAELVKKLKSDPERLLTTILIGNNVVNIAASALATVVMMELFATYNFRFADPVAATTGIMTFIVLIFGEITPKTIATNKAEFIAFLVAKPMQFLVIVLTPISVVVNLFTRWLAKLAGKNNKPIITEEELKTMVRIGEKVGEIKSVERKMIHNLFNFDTISVGQVMIPRHDMFCVEENQKVSEIIDDVIKQGYSRIPVYQNSKDKIVGIVYVKDILKCLKDKKDSHKIKKIMKDAFFVPETKKIDALLNVFKRKKQHFAVVVDEHGLVIGSITIEDVLEEIVGDIKDETDLDEDDIKKTGRNEWVVRGKLEVKDINKVLKLKIKETPDYDTLAGYLMFKLGRVPKKGESLKTSRTIYTVHEKRGQRIKWVKINKK